MMMLAGVDPNAVVQTKVPYVATEITDRFDPDTTVVVYAVSEKDMAEDPRFDFPSTGLKMKRMVTLHTFKSDRVWRMLNHYVNIRTLLQFPHLHLKSEARM